jgi:hypothetical protein
MQEGNASDDHSGCAVGALHGAFVEKCLLQGMQAVTLGQAFNRGDVFLPYGAYLCDARLARISIDQNGASAALAFPATILTPGEVELLAQHREQAGLPVRVNFISLSVYIQLLDTGHLQIPFAEKY